MQTEQHLVHNYLDLAVSPLRQTALDIIEAGLDVIRTEAVITHNVELTDDVLSIAGKTYRLNDFDKLYVLGVGKCSYDAAVALERILGRRIHDGIILDVRTGETPLTKIRALVGTHPYPSEDNIRHTAAILELAGTIGPRDLAIVVVSGGGSALLCQPATHTAEDEVRLTKYLFKCGASIHELNIVRKHLSKARGGGIAEALYPATVATLLFSDVPGDDIATISSGPTILDATVLDEARKIFVHYDVETHGFKASHLFETPKDASLFSQITQNLVLTNGTALTAMAEKARSLGLQAEIVNTKVEGEARVVAASVVARLKEAAPNTVLLYGGETTVTITGPGKGGRNEELALAALPLLSENELVVSLASDGRDNTEYAGGIADSFTQTRAQELGLRSTDYLYTNDAFSFFHTLQQGVTTGYTGANIADLVIALKLRAA